MNIKDNKCSMVFVAWKEFFYGPDAKSWCMIVPVLILLSALSPACSRFTQTNPPSQSTPPFPTPEPTTPALPATVVFNAHIPQDTPLQEPVYVYILDEVTGLALNPTHYEMQAVDETNYTTSIPFPVGTVFKYRYARQGAYVSIEHTSMNRQVRYRMYSVEGPSEIYDVISAWSDTTFNSPNGRIKGEAINSDNGIPIPGLLISAGGQQTYTASDGSFLIEGLPPGTHTLFAYSIDGSYKPYQQGAVIAPDSTTPTPIQLTPASLVNVVFTLIVPPDTMPAVPIRIAGSLYQLGNTFADLTGGVNVLASRMPVLTPLPDGRYSASVTLPAGAYIEYKYTLGDGFWNAEHNQDENFQLRHLIVPETNVIIEDQVTSWGSGEAGPVVFDITVPEMTPAQETVSIQFNPYGWTEPIPMWRLEENHWAYVLYSPLNVLERFGYRYCRNDQCGSADDILTMGNDSFGRIVEIGERSQTIQEIVGDWVWLDPNLASAFATFPTVEPRDPDFMAGVEFQTYYHPSWRPHYASAFKETYSLNANWVILSPTWTYSRTAPPILQQVSGSDPFWNENISLIADAQEMGLNVAIKPAPTFQNGAPEWWASTPRDFAWWVVWFERYHIFALHHADLAQKSGAQTLILGGEWILPALPGGFLPNGQPSGVPSDAEVRWRDILSEIKDLYQGTIVWALPFKGEISNAPPFLDLIDMVLLEWSPQLSQNPSASEFELYTQTIIYLDQSVLPFKQKTGLPILISLAYPSADGGLTGCIPDPLAVYEGECLDINLLSRPNPDIPTVLRDLDEQMQVYNATLTAINEREWIDGFIASGFYPPVALQDKSLSIHGKPAGDILRFWFSAFLGSETN